MGGIVARLAWRELRASRVGRRSAAGAPASSNSARIRPVGVLLGWSCGKLDLARPPEVSCWAVLCRQRRRKLKFGSNLTGGRCWGEISASSTWRDLRRSRFVGPSCAAGARACSRSDRIRPLGGCQGGIVANSAWRELRGSWTVQCCRSPPQAHVRLEFDRWGAFGVELWHARLGTSSGDLVVPKL